MGERAYCLCPRFPPVDDTQLTVAGRRGHHAVCRAVVACTLALAVTPRPHTGARSAVVTAQSLATLGVVHHQVWNSGLVCVGETQIL